MKWKHFPRYWPFVRGIHRWPVNSPHKGQWRTALMFSLICTGTNDWANNGDTGDLRRHRAHYDVTVMFSRQVNPLRMEHQLVICIGKESYCLRLSWLYSDTPRCPSQHKSHYSKRLPISNACFCINASKIWIIVNSSNSPSVERAIIVKWIFRNKFQWNLNQNNKNYPQNFEMYLQMPLAMWPW